MDGASTVSGQPAGVAKVRYVAEGTLATLEAAYNLYLEEKK